MKKRQILRAAAGLGLLAAPAYAQAPFPNSSIRMVVPFPPGGNTDILGACLPSPSGGHSANPLSSTIAAGRAVSSARARCIAPDRTGTR